MLEKEKRRGWNIKMLIRGKTTYLPKDIIKQLQQIKVEENLKTDSEALKKMANFSKIGMEVSRKIKKKKKNIIEDILEGLF